MRTGIDATPLLGPRTGVGRYTASLVTELAHGHGRPARAGGAEAPLELVLTAFTARGGAALHDQAPPGTVVRSRRVPARLLRWSWRRTGLPAVTRLCGPVELFHATNFVLPPPGRAAGVVTVHDTSYLRFPQHVSRASRALVDLVPLSIERADVVVVPSSAVAGEVAEAYPRAADRIVVTPLGVAPEWATEPRPAASWLAAQGIHGPYALFIGSMDPRKDLATLLAAHRSAAGAGKTPALVLVGPAGWGSGPTPEDVRRAGVLHLGPRPEADLRRLVAGARALVYPSLYEGFGLPLLEARACGTPIIASDIPTTREVLGSTADLEHLFPVGDVDALAQALADPPADDARSRSTRRAQVREHTWARTAELTRAAYAQALASRGSGLTAPRPCGSPTGC